MKTLLNQKIINSTKLRIVETLKTQKNSTLPYVQEIEIILSQVPVLTRLNFDVKFFVQSIFPTYTNRYDFHEPTVDRALRKYKAKLSAEISNNIGRIVDRYNNSDDFDDLSYCINDLVPETRNDTGLLEFYIQKSNEILYNNNNTTKLQVV